MPIVTLTTDFGTRDSYVAELKGVLLQQGPADLRIVDLTHEIAAHDVREAAFFLRAAVPRFPAGTIHVAVIDPGVGSARHAIVAQSGGQFLVGPDNGIFAWVLDASARVHRLPVPAAASVSATFHGRDLFAPAAARLALGVAVQDLGPALADPVRLAWPEPTVEHARVIGEVVHVDRFGNLITNLERNTLPRVPLHIRLGGQPIGPLRDHYAEVSAGALIALIGGAGLLEVAARDESAAQVLGAGLGARVDVDWVSPPQS